MMKLSHSLSNSGLSLLALAVGLPLASHAQFTLLDDMEGVDNWTGNGSILADPADAGNSVYAITGTGNAGNSEGYLSLGAGSIADGATGTLFFRVRTTENAGMTDWVFGASDVAAPNNNWGDFEGYIAYADEGMRVRAGGGFNEMGAAPADTWYNVWLVLDNANDTTTAYYNTGLVDATDGATITGSGTFRNGTTDSLTSLYVRNNESSTTGYIDDIYYASGAVLSNPIAAIPEPSTYLLFAGLLAFGAVAMKRRA